MSSSHARPHQTGLTSPVRARLAALGGFAGAGLGVIGLSAVGFGLPCPWRAFTGTLCPLCGSTHLGLALLQGDLAAAFWANPFVFVLLVVLASLGLVWGIEAAGGPVVRLPPRWRASADQWWLVLGVLGITFAVLRNLP